MFDSFFGKGFFAPPGLFREAIAACLIFLVYLLGLYWFIPGGVIDFSTDVRNSNFSISSEYEEMQFYENMRFPNPRISYKIFDCTLQKEDDMEYAFEIISNITILDFYEVEENEEIKKPKTYNKI